MVKCYRKAVSLSDLWVSQSEKLSDFYASSWQSGESPIPLLLLRVVLALLALMVLFWSVVEAPTSYWLIFLTNWGMLLVTLMMVTGSFVSIMAFSRNTDSDDLPWYVSLYWLIFNMAIPTAFLITALYWILLYDPDPIVGEPITGRLLWLDIATHGLNSCIALTELLVSRTPVYMLHVYQPLGIGLWYAGFSAIYYAAGGTNGNGEPWIYEILDWRQPRRSGYVVAGSVAGLLIIYTVIWSLAFARDKVSENLVRTTSHSLPMTPPDQHMPRDIV